LGHPVHVFRVKCGDYFIFGKSFWRNQRPDEKEIVNLVLFTASVLHTADIMLV